MRIDQLRPHFNFQERRVIDILREKYPEHTWAYDNKAQHWVTDAGWYVYCCTGMHDNIGHYRRSDTLEIVWMHRSWV